MEMDMNMTKDQNDVRYHAKVIEKIETGPNTWKCLRIGIFKEERGKDPVQIGSYVRKYSSFFNTFFPFRHENGKWYALYSADYTTTRIMELPSCNDIGGEEGDANGFCPTGFYVPNYVEGSYDHNGKKHVYQEDQFDEDRVWNGKIKSIKWADLKYRPFGFVSGCVWGDDWSWKIRYIDLREADKGKIKAEPKFGYIWLPRNLELRDVIQLDDYINMKMFRIAVPITFREGKNYNHFDLSKVMHGTRYKCTCGQDFTLHGWKDDGILPKCPRCFEDMHKSKIISE